MKEETTKWTHIEKEGVRKLRDKWLQAGIKTLERLYMKRSCDRWMTRNRKLGDNEMDLINFFMGVNLMPSL